MGRGQGLMFPSLAGGRSLKIQLSHTSDGDIAVTFPPSNSGAHSGLLFTEDASHSIWHGLRPGEGEKWGWAQEGVPSRGGSRAVGDPHLQSAARAQPWCQTQPGSELRGSEKSLCLCLWDPTHLVSHARLADTRCFWKMKYTAFYDGSVIPTVPCQVSLFLVCCFKKRTACEMPFPL